MAAAVAAGTASRDPDTASKIPYNNYLTRQDRLLLDNLLHDLKQAQSRPYSQDIPGGDRLRQRKQGPSDVDIRGQGSSSGQDSGYQSAVHSSADEADSDALPDEGTDGVERATGKKIDGPTRADPPHDALTLDQLHGLNDHADQRFEPTVIQTFDLRDVRARLPKVVDDWLLQPYIKLAGQVVRNKTDVVMLTHLIVYLGCILPSAVRLFYSFSWTHAVLHWFFQSWYAGSYTLLMHQHIHQRGVLHPRFKYLDYLFPFVMDPLMGHTWNTYYYHHVKHHHVEGNGPDDLSSTIRFQRDELTDFLKYLGRFYFLIWFDLPLYFIRKNKPWLALKTGLSEYCSYTYLFLAARYLDWRAALFVHLLPLLIIRTALMVGNWGQHAFVDELEPDSDFRSSITLIDVASNRFCFNDGFHTSHHLNPRRHWREHPMAFLRQKQRYANEHALVFTDIDFNMITISLLRKDYARLARHFVPIGSQVGMSLEEIAAMLKTKTRKFTEDEIASKWPA